MILKPACQNTLNVQFFPIIVNKSESGFDLIPFF
jgi:hypothetical protein